MENEIWYQFIIIRDFKKYPVIASILHDFEGEHLAGYVYIDPIKGTNLDIINLFSGNENDANTNKNLVEEKIRAILPFEHFSETNFEIADQQIIQNLNLTIPDYIESYKRENLKPFREEKAYDKFRVAGFPYDIQVLLINNRNTPELIWARVENYDSENKIGISRLIVQPHQNFNLNIDDKLMFKLMEINKSLYPVGIIDNKPAKKWWKFW
ncbi:hypothetical protein GCM10022217_17160 [Chryseobacterium ginsenosidimutans]|uniref:hypothetical protein n=1 Tax=Chryseobacterium ginsenosidimutans TaxID=687846 RepID=UPI0031CDD63A